MKQPIPSIIPIRAAVLREPGGPLKIEALDMEGPREDELLVRIVASGICHAEKVHGMPVRPPQVPPAEH